MPGVAFVVNGSLVRGGGHFVALCREGAARHGWDCDVLVTEKAEAGVSAANGAALGGVDLVIAVGGDGTVRGCAEGLAGTGVPLGIVAHGTANLLARSLGVPVHPRAALSAALGPGAVDRTIDLAIADGVPFTAMAGMGLDAAVVAGTRLKHQFGWLAYAMSGAVHLALPPARFSISLDDGPPIERMARSVVAGNSGLLPGGFSLLPDARLDDGMLDVGVLAPHGPLGWPRVATRVLTNSRHQDRMLERFQAKKVEITASAALPREVDGELVAAGHRLTISVRPAALLVRVPAPAPALAGEPGAGPLPRSAPVARSAANRPLSPANPGAARQPRRRLPVRIVSGHTSIAGHIRRTEAGMITEIPIMAETLHAIHVRNFRCNASFRDHGDRFTLRPGLSRFRHAPVSHASPPWRVRGPGPLLTAGVPVAVLLNGDIPVSAHNAKAGDVAVNAYGGAAESLIGTVGRVTVSIPVNGPGEVLLPVRGGSEAFAAWSDEPIARHSRVIVVDALSARSVLVTPAPV